MTTHRMAAPDKIELDGVDAIVPCCGRRGRELPDGDLVALAGTPGEANVDCTGPAGLFTDSPDRPGDPRSTPEAAAERAAWTKDIAKILRGLTKADPALLPGLRYAADFLDPPPPIAGKALIMAGPSPTTRTPEEIERMDAAEREQLAAAEEIDDAQEQETAELAALRERAQAGSNDLGKYAEELVRARKLNLLDLVLTEMRVRLDVLSDAAFGDGSPDQYGYEVAVQQRCRAKFTEMAAAAEQVRGAAEAEQRKAALLKGVTVQARMPDGRL